MHKDIEDNMNPNEFCITNYIATIEGRLQSNAKAIVKYPNLGADYHCNELMKIVESLSAVREKLHDAGAWCVEVK